MTRRRCVALALTALAALAGATPAWASEALADKHACLNCHQVDKKMVGPAFKAIAEKYRGRSDASQLLLVKLAQGSTGVWGQIPMPGMQVPAADAQALIAWILAQP